MIAPDTALISRVELAARRQHLFRPGDTLIVALSGGADSTLLLDLLVRLPGYHLRLVAAHLNHSLRGTESDGDEEFCRKLALRHAIPFELRRIDVKSLAAEKRLNLEDAGRRARVEFLDQIKEKYGASAVALAHHADDQAETVLMRLLRGSGMTGLSGMTFRNSRGYIRPLLEISRSEIEHYLRHCGMEWREDASNSDTTFLRNRIRHQLLPTLEEYNPAIRSTLAATASILGDDELLLDEMTEKAFSETCRMEEGRVVCGVGLLQMFKTALRRRVLRHAFKQLTGTLERITLRHIDALCDLLDSDRPNVRLALPQGFTAVREYDLLSLLKTEDIPVDCAFEFTISGPGIYQIPSGGTVTVEPVGTSNFPSDSGTLHLDPAMVPFPWLVRTVRPGDRIIPLGMSGRKKVKDIFIDRKIPLSERKRIPLIFSGADLIWIAGVCTSELCRLGAASGNPVRVRWQE